jgi:hypothetical protein
MVIDLSDENTLFHQSVTDAPSFPRSMKMKKVLLFGLALAGVASIATAQSYNFTAAEVNTLPAGLSASYDGGVDAIVVPFGTMSPTIGADHAGGDGHVARIGDLAAGGGGYNWIFPTTQPSIADVRISGWVYVDWETVDGVAERDYIQLIRLQNADPQVTGSAAGTRQGYFFLVTKDSSWGGLATNPTNKRPFIMKRVGTVHTLIGSEGTTDVNTGWHRFSFEASGTTLTGSIDGSVVATGTDSTYTTGGWAVGYYDDNSAGGTNPYAAAYDNLLVENLAPVQDWINY